MKTKNILTYVCIIVLFTCCTDAISPISKPYNFSTVDEFITNNLSVYKNSLVVLVSQNGQLIYKKEINLTMNDKRVIASASKWLSGAVILTLVDEGKLSLTDTVGKFLPLFTQNRKGNITIRQLFSHTSGFPGDSPEKYEYRTDLTLAQAVDSLAIHTALIHSPGTTFNYGSASMHVAGRIAEIVTGKSWQTLFNEKIAIPCSMQAQYLIASPKNPLIAGGVRTSARDYLNFLEMIVNKGVFRNKRVLSESAITEMQKDQTNGAAIENTPYPTNPTSGQPSASVRYGIGNWLDIVDVSGTIQETSSPGLFGTHPWQDPKHKLAGIIFTRTEHKISNATSIQLRTMIRDIVAQSVE
ncbi:serine hydrolase domain-containing protein [Xanthocytophaga agilis]|uniref:Serine hydrolase domain-containing protein n=1 Tax=Xanthocytophaga agilis TaxID=3048010 RepID=A0AAE3R6Z5_9BACT|nr:serine hydrolase domain-containing protein [Xanthocytophaga agilis]MDJ1504884.1 serine hydrolase domain-containing protein [Xanthocytophaga agilis]